MRKQKNRPKVLIRGRFATPSHYSETVYDVRIAATERTAIERQNQKGGKAAGYTDEMKNRCLSADWAADATGRYRRASRHDRASS